MSSSFQLQDPGEGIHEAQILEVNVASGESVSEGDELFLIETDKAAVGIPSPFTGTIEDVCVSEGDDVEVGDVLVTYTTSEDGADQESEENGKQDNRDDETPVDDQDEGTREEESKDASREQEDVTAEDREEKDAEEGKDADEEKETDEEKDADNVDGRSGAGSRPERIAAAPATRKLADELGVDIDTLDGSGPDGRVEPEDVRDAGGARRGKRSAARRGSDSLPDFSEWGDVESVDLIGVRRRIARKMQQAWQTIPHVMHGDTFDITRLEEIRAEHEHDFEQEGGKLTFTVFVLKAVAAALREFPRFNASLDAGSEQLILKKYCHIGVAVDTDEGLLVPVIRDVDRKSLSRLSIELVQIAKRARSGELKPAEMRGGCITITNPGAVGGDIFTPIINYPEVAIVGLGAARLEPIVVESDDGNSIQTRLRLPLTVTFDHRVNDGADAARFAARIGALMTSPEELFLEA